MKTRNQRIIEVIQASELPGAVVEVSHRNGNHTCWTAVKLPLWAFCYDDYRVSIPSEPTTRRITKKDWDGHAVVWYRRSEKHPENLVVGFSLEDVGFYVKDYFTSFKDGVGEYSFTRKQNDWHPFTTTEQGTGMKVIASTEEGFEL